VEAVCKRRQGKRNVAWRSRKPKKGSGGVGANPIDVVTDRYQEESLVDGAEEVGAVRATLQ
jgi:hypothetical protein